MLLVCFHFIVRQQQKLSSLFTQKTMEVEPEKHEDGLDKDDSEAWEVSLILKSTSRTSGTHWW